MAEEGFSADQIELNLYFNGIDGTIGEYLLEPMTPRQVAAMVANERRDPDELEELKKRRALETEPHLAPMYGVDPDDLAETGWGVIFAPDTTDAEKQALSPLLELRKEQAGNLYQDFPGQRAYHPGDTKQDFLGRCKAGPGPADPKKVPYYLLIVGSPESIPYEFQYQMDIQYGVGRIQFGTPDEYAQYAKTVVAAEIERPYRSPDIALFGVRNRGDRATQLSADHLIQPLCECFAEQRPNCLLSERATKENLRRLLGGESTPALLVSASHGMVFPNSNRLQLAHQGAILCQDWPGPLRHRGPIPGDFYFAGDDVEDEADFQGLIALFFACFGGGTPKTDDFPHLLAGSQDDIAPCAFVASLPKRLLGHRRGALAVVGHVERVWSYSFI
jgi:hypothetical protein